MIKISDNRSFAFSQRNRLEINVSNEGIPHIDKASDCSFQFAGSNRSAVLD